MSVSITFTADASTAEAEVKKLQANITQSLGAIDAKMQDTARKTGQSAEAWRSGLTGMSQAVTRNVVEQGNLSKAFLQTGQSAQTQLNAFQRLQQQYQQTAKATEDATQATTRFGQQTARIGSSLRSLAAGFGLILGVQGFASLVKGLVDAGLQMERFERTLTAAVGSSRGAVEAFRFITDESNRLGQSVTEMVPIFVQLTAATRNTVLEGERTRELFSAMASAGQAVGLSTDAVAGAMLGLTQIISQNAIQLDEFRNQFASRIPGAMLETAKALKTLGVTQRGTIAEMLKGFQQGRIGIDDLTKAVTMGLQEISRTAPSMANSVEAAFRQLSNAIFQLSADIARSGLLDLLAKIARFAGRELQGIGRVFGIANVSDIQQLERLNQEMAATIKLRDEAQRKAAEPSRLETAKDILGWETAKQSVEGYNAAITETQQKIGKLTQQVEERQRVDAAAEKARSDRVNEENRQNKLIEDTEKRSREGAQDAAARARANVSLTQERVNQEKIALEQMQALREQALERDYTTAVENTAQTKAAQEDIEKAFAIRRIDIAKQTALEDANLQERAAIQIRDTRIAAIKAAESAAQASAAGPGATAEAQINANKRSAASALELQAVNLAAQNSIAEAVAKRTAAEADAEKKTSALIKGERLDQLKVTEQTLQREAELRQQTLQSQAAILDAEQGLVAAQVEGLVLTREEGLAKTQALQVEALNNRRAQLESEFQEELRLLQQRVDAHEVAESKITDLHTKHQGDLQALNIQQQALEQTHRNELLQGWREWVQDVRGALGNFLFDWMDGQIDSIKDVLDSLKSYFFRVIADMAAKAATTHIIVPIVGAVLGGIGGGAGGALGAATQGAGLLSQLMGGGGGIPGGGATGTGGGLLETGGLALTGIGLAKQLYSYLGLDTAVDFLGTGFKTLGESLLTGIDGIFGTAFSATEQAAQEAALLLADVTGDMGRGVAGAAGGGLGTAASVFGGAAAIAGGIYGALNATNNASRAAFAASAAAGTAALASTALVAAGVIAASSGWTGIGLIAAGVTAILGTIAEMVIKPEGPTLAVGRPSGLGIGVEGSQLAVSGDLGSRVMRRDKVDPGVARGVQAQMEEGITNAVISIVQTINAVALNPAALLGPTQDALQAALNNMKPLNSSNAKKMEQDITEQLRFINVQIVAGMLGPLNDAFNQLRDQGTLQEQLDRLPGTTAGLVQVFQTMNKQLEEIAGSKNTDVLRQLSGVRNQVENFGNRIAGTAGQIAEQIVDQIVTSMQASVVPTFTEQITQVSGLLNDSLRALETLRATQKTLEGAGLQGGGIKAQIDRLTSTMANQMGRISTEIVDQIVTSMQATVVPTLAGQIRQFAGLMDQSLQALGLLRGTQQALEGAGVSGGAVGGQIERLMQATSEQAGRISTDIVSGSLQSLATDLQHVLVQPLSVQATTVSTLFNDSLAAMNTLVTQATRLETVGIDAGGVRQQIDRILGGMLDSIQAITEQSFATGNLTEFLNVLLSIPEALANLNPVTAQIRQMGVAFAQVAGPIQQVIDATSRELQTPEERATDASQRMTELRDAIAQTGDAIDQALPLYAQLGQTIQANAAAQIEVINQWADEQTQAVNEAYDIQLDAVRSWAEQATKETNDYVDAAQQAYADAFDAEIDKINAYTDAMMQAYEEMYDAQVKAVNTGFDAQIDALGSWVDVMTKGLQAWVETSTQMINDWAESAKTTASQVQTLNQAILAELSPAQQRTTLESRRALFQERVRVGGPGAEQAMTELISINQQLLGLAKQSDNLALQKQATDELKRLQALMTEQLVAQTGQTDPVMAQIGVALEQERVLNLIAEGQRKHTEYITTTQKAEQEALEQRRAAQLDAIEVARTAILTEFERVRNNKIAELEIIRTHIQGQFEALRTAHLDEIEATRAAREVQLATDRDTQLKGIAYWQEEAVKAIKRDMVYQLQLVQYELQKLVSLQYGVITGTPLPLPAPPIAAQRGGLIGLASGQYYANGGLVRVMAEPGETYWSGHSASQDRALASVNSAFPRFASGGIVPGFGRGDTVPMWVAPGTRFVNRSASQAIGYADGGVVPSQGHSSHGMPSITIDLRGSTFANASDAHKVKDIFEKDIIRIMEEYRRRAHVDTRIR